MDPPKIKISSELIQTLQEDCLGPCSIFRGVSIHRFSVILYLSIVSVSEPDMENISHPMTTLVAPTLSCFMLLFWPLQYLFSWKHWIPPQMITQSFTNSIRCDPFVPGGGVIFKRVEFSPSYKAKEFGEQTRRKSTKSNNQRKGCKSGRI